MTDNRNIRRQQLREDYRRLRELAAKRRAKMHYDQAQRLEGQAYTHAMNVLAERHGFFRVCRHWSRIRRALGAIGRVPA